jgi:hypothetical protein
MAAWTVLYSGSASIGTSEYSLTDHTTTSVPKAKTDKVTATLVMDLNALVAGDSFRVTLYDKSRSGDTQRVVSNWYIYGAQAEPIFMTPPLMIGEGWDLTIKKLGGTDRTIPSEIRAYS